jgi:EmrB/QacA subfamily drug resistance transporter
MDAVVSSSIQSGHAAPYRPVSRYLPLAMASALFMDLLDSAALGAALPTLAREFHTDPVHLKLALTAYLLTMATLAPASGWLADRFGPRRVFVNAVRVYLLGSLLCGLSNSVQQLILARILQGMGGALMTPVARLIVVATTPRARLIRALNAFTIPAIIGPMLGPAIAGFILEVASWRWIFFINIPVGIVGMFVVLRIVPRLRHQHPGPFDFRGFALLACAIGALMTLSESVDSTFLSRTGELLLAVASVAASVLFVRHALKATSPMLDLRLLATPTYRASLLGGSLMRLGVGASPFLLPLLLQVALGWSPLKAGLVMATLMIGALFARVGAPYIIGRLGFRAALVYTCIATALFSLAPAVFTQETSLAVILLLLTTLGFFRAANFVASGSIAYADIGPETVSRASTLSSVTQQLSLGFGVTVAGFTLYLTAGGTTHLSTTDFLLPFATLGATALLAVAVYARLNECAGDHLTARARPGTRGFSGYH